MHTLTLTDVRDKLQSGDLRPTEVLEACLARIAATEPVLNACITVCAEQALKTAEALEKSGPDPSRPLWGVPLTLKDLLCTKDIRTTCASRMLEDFTPPYDAFVVRKLREAGAIITAKTNLDEFAMGASTEFSFFGRTMNPRDPERVPGGSSGGSAASVTAGQTYGTLGSDTGGSIRQPAGLCGCVGLKPTYGRVSRYGAVAYGSSFDQVGPMARNVADCALLLRTIAGYDPQDAVSSNLPVPDFVSALGRKDLKGVKLGVPREYWEQGLSDEVRAACLAAVETAGGLGADIVDVSLPHADLGVATYYILASAEAGTNLARFDGVRYGLRTGEDKGLTGMYTASRAAGFGEEAQRRILLGTYVLSAGYYDAYYKKAAQVRRLIADDFAAALESCDFLLAPSCPVTAWKAGEINDPLTAYKMDVLTLSLNLAGLPGLCLPVGRGKDSGLPVGLQIMGRAFDEAGLVRVGHALEAALPPLGMPLP